MTAKIKPRPRRWPPQWSDRKTHLAGFEPDPEDMARYARAMRRSISCHDRMCGAGDCETCHPGVSRSRHFNN